MNQDDTFKPLHKPCTKISPWTTNEVTSSPGRQSERAKGVISPLKPCTKMSPWAWRTKNTPLKVFFFQGTGHALKNTVHLRHWKHKSVFFCQIPINLEQRFCLGFMPWPVIFKALFRFGNLSKMRKIHPPISLFKGIKIWFHLSFIRKSYTPGYLALFRNLWD